MAEEIRAEEFSDYLTVVASDFESKSLRPVIDECVPILRQSVRDNFTSSASPDNVGWVPRKKIGDGHPLLVESGDLMQAAVGTGSGSVSEADDRSVTIGVKGDVIRYAAIHNFGGVTRPMPQREFMGAKEERLVECADIMAEYIVVNFF